MDIGSIFGNLELVLLRDVLVAAVLARSSDNADAEVLGFLVGFFCEAAGEDIGTRMLLAREVQRQQGELRACAARHEQDFIIVAEAHELLDVSFRLVLHGCVFLRAVADLEDRFAAAAEIQELRLRLFEHGQRQRCRARVEVVDAICFQRKNLPHSFETSSFPVVSLLYSSAKKSEKQARKEKHVFFSRTLDEAERMNYNELVRMKNYV